MFDYIKSAQSTQSLGQSDLMQNGSTAQDITDAFQQELAKAIADSQDVQPMLADPSSCQGAFDKMDASGDGQLSHDEAIQALMPVVGDQDVAERIYGMLDPKGEGSVTEDRFNQCLNSVIKVTSFEAHLTMTEMTQVSASGELASDFSDAVDGLRNVQDGISGKKVGSGALSMDDFWMKLMAELDKNRQGDTSQGGTNADQANSSVLAAQASGQVGALSMQSVTYAEASISVETMSANLGAVFSAVA